ncbi:MAG: tetratricopeptide repeat protein [Enhygromyxa sp.]
MDRLGMLEELVVAKPDDPFPRYGLAMEYKKLGRHDEAVQAFEELTRAHPSYVPSYLMFGNLLEALGRAEQAAEIYTRGIEAARAAGNDHAAGELQAARDACGS